MQLLTHNDEINAFIADLSKKLNKKKVKFIFAPCSYVQAEGDVRVNGYFDDEPAELAVSIGKPLKQWFPCLVHESCHFDQWSTGSKLWKACDKFDKVDKSLFDWLNGAKLTKPEVKLALETIRELELDCERRTVAKIEKFNLPIDIPAYIKNANAYINFHNYVGLTRKWYKIGSEPYNNAKILDLMPDNLDGDYSALPKKLIPLFDECV